MFCTKCGSILLPKKKGSKMIIECHCGYIEKDLSKFKKIKEVVKQEKDIEVIDEDIEILPLTDEICPKCSNKKAYYWTIQTRAGDEPETKFLKCKKCKHIWRDYG